MRSSSVFASALLISGAAAVAPLPAVAVTRTAQFNVTATVQASCSISASDLSFGTYSSDTAVDATSSITATCTPMLPFSISLNDGQNGGGSVFARKMRGVLLTSNFLAYELHTSALRNVVWGDQPASSVLSVGLGVAQVLTVYGRIPSGASAPAGAYSDTVTATITY